MPYSPFTDESLFRRRLYRRTTTIAPEQSKNPKDDWTRVAPTCPPDTEVHARGAYLWDTRTGAGWWVDTMDADLGTGGNAEVSPFTNANYYRGVVLGRAFGTTTPQTFETDEYATAAAAQTAIEALIEAGSIYNTTLPLVLLIVKNDGTVGPGGAILPIDAINRGRSYIYREIRPWLHIHTSGPT